MEEQNIIDNRLKHILLTSDKEFMLNCFNRSYQLIFINANRLNILEDCYYNIKKEKLNNKKIQNTKKEVLQYFSKVKAKNKDSLRSQLISKFNLDFYILGIIEKDLIDNIISEYINKNNSNVLPTIILNKESTPNRKKENWKGRDNELCQKVIIAIEEIKSEIPLRQITKSYISKKLAFRLRKENIQFIPKTIQMIEDNIETKEVYKKRKIIFVIKQLISEGENVVISKITDKINISKDYQDFRGFILDTIENIDKL